MLTRVPTESSAYDSIPLDLRLPGFNVPYNYVDNSLFASALETREEYQSLFTSALRADSQQYQYTLPLTTLREFTMLRLMNEITDKVDWHKKVFKEDIVEMWKKEALSRPRIDITEEMVDWCIEELRFKAKIFEKTNMTVVYDADVVKSDKAVSDELRKSLREAVKLLEDVPSTAKDWHPGSNETVLDLVHPSLFPLIFGRTRILLSGTTSLADCIERCGEGFNLPLSRGHQSYEWDTSTWDREVKPRIGKAEKFQWLPCDVDIAGDAVKIKSYVNNLHPKHHAGLYTIIEKIISCAIPLWNVTLTRQKSPNAPDNRALEVLESLGLGFQARLRKTDTRFKRVIYPLATRTDDTKPVRGENEGEDGFNARYDEWSQDAPAKQPDVGPFVLSPALENLEKMLLDSDFQPSIEHTVDLKRDFGKTGLQIIVKLANIELTPEKPEYAGGTWHIEGKENEHICATALYYYDSENVTPSFLSFRQFVNGPDVERHRSGTYYDQWYYQWLPDVFGCKHGGPPIQDIGSVETKEGRLLTFPNILQHQVQPFRLVDGTKSGHRKILALFLVDPHMRVISTANVPCQRLDWWREAIKEKMTPINKLPMELQDEIFNHIKFFPTSVDEAKKHRLKLMEDRRKYTLYQEELFTYASFSLCEH